MENILVTGAHGQIGTELVESLKLQYPDKRILSLDIKPKETQGNIINPDFLQVDLLQKDSLEAVFSLYKPIQVYHLAAILSAIGEKDPLKAWNLNMTGLLNILDLSRKHQTQKVFWPSSIAVFGPFPNEPKNLQEENMEPTTVYGISKLAGEHWSRYYKKHYGLDVRSLRFPGLISYKTQPGGGTTDYAVQIYLDALQKKSFSCYLAPDTLLPMMYMDDAIQAIHNLMEASKDKIKTLAYNIAGFSASPKQFATSIQETIPEFKIEYTPNDPRQLIADSWPNEIDDAVAHQEWNWESKFDLSKTTQHMLANIEI